MQAGHQRLDDLGMQDARPSVLDSSWHLNTTSSQHQATSLDPGGPSGTVRSSLSIHTPHRVYSIFPDAQVASGAHVRSGSASDAQPHTFPRASEGAAHRGVKFNTTSCIREFVPSPRAQPAQHDAPDGIGQRDSPRQLHDMDDLGADPRHSQPVVRTRPPSSSGPQHASGSLLLSAPQRTPQPCMHKCSPPQQPHHPAAPGAGIGSAPGAPGRPLAAHVQPGSARAVDRRAGAAPSQFPSAAFALEEPDAALLTRNESNMDQRAGTIDELLADDGTVVGGHLDNPVDALPDGDVLPSRSTINMTARAGTFDELVDGDGRYTAAAFKPTSLLDMDLHVAAQAGPSRRDDDPFLSGATTRAASPAAGSLDLRRFVSDADVGSLEPMLDAFDGGGGGGGVDVSGAVSRRYNNMDSAAGPFEALVDEDGDVLEPSEHGGEEEEDVAAHPVAAIGPGAGGVQTADLLGLEQGPGAGAGASAAEAQDGWEGSELVEMDVLTGPGAEGSRREEGLGGGRRAGGGCAGGSESGTLSLQDLVRGGGSRGCASGSSAASSGSVAQLGPRGVHAVEPHRPLHGALNAGLQASAWGLTAGEAAVSSACAAASFPGAHRPAGTSPRARHSSAGPPEALQAPGAHSAAPSGGSAGRRVPAGGLMWQSPAASGYGGGYQGGYGGGGKRACPGELAVRNVLRGMEGARREMRGQRTPIPEGLLLSDLEQDVEGGFSETGESNPVAMPPGSFAASGHAGGFGLAPVDPLGDEWAAAPLSAAPMRNPLYASSAWGLPSSPQPVTAAPPAALAFKQPTDAITARALHPAPAQPPAVSSLGASSTAPALRGCLHPKQSHHRQEVAAGGRVTTGGTRRSAPLTIRTAPSQYSGGVGWAGEGGSGSVPLGDWHSVASGSTVRDTLSMSSRLSIRTPRKAYGSFDLNETNADVHGGGSSGQCGTLPSAMSQLRGPGDTQRATLEDVAGGWCPTAGGLVAGAPAETQTQVREQMVTPQEWAFKVECSRLEATAAGASSGDDATHGAKQQAAAQGSSLRAGTTLLGAFHPQQQ